jgi:transposase
MFGNTELKLGKSAAKLPPILHDVTITKRINGKWILNIPCPRQYTQKPIATDPTAICGVDPGARTFLTVFDETNHEAYKLGDEPERCILKLLIKRAEQLRADSSQAAFQAARIDIGSRR